jgi:hypothetical protein
MIPGTEGAGEFILYTDWSAEAMAGVLHQLQHGVERFVAARGRKNKSYEKNYHSSKGELAALHYALGKFEPWLKMSRFTVRTDNTTVTNWSTMEVRNGCVRRWLDYFTEFNFVLQHIPGPGGWSGIRGQVPVSHWFALPKGEQCLRDCP